MNKRVFVDFESRSQCDIWTAGAYRYAEHPTTEILCLAWAVDGGPVRGAIHGSELRQSIKELNALVQEGAEFHAHNAFFERCMWKHKLTPKYGALPIPIRQWRCTAAKVAAHALPRALANAAAALGCTHKKDLDGAKVMKALASSTGVIDDARLRRLLEYCEQDVRTERDIDQKLPDLCPSEQEVWFMDQYLNDTGVCVDVQAVRNAVTLVEQATKEGNNELFTLTGGLINAGTKREAIKKYLEAKGLKLPNLQKATVKEAITKVGGDNLRILQLRQQLSLTSNAKYSAFLAAASPDGRIRDLLVYHGASTGRWSGKLVQIQNLVKAAIKPHEIDAAIGVLKTNPEAFGSIYDTLPTLSSCIRGMLIPTPGHTMFITDFAAIEARVVMWLAGEEKGLVLFRNQDADPKLPDIYVHMARGIYGRPTLTKKDTKERTLGKQTVLGSGFGMGPAKFQETCDKYEVDLGPRTETITKPDGTTVKVSPLATKSVYAYRNTFPNVPKFWYAMEDAARKAVITPGSRHTVGKIVWYMDGDFLRMQLPVGRTIVYHHPRVDAEGKLTFMAVNSLTNKYVREATWGGKLVENAVQATARDLMVAGMFGLLRAGYRILFTVHDELVVESKTGSCEEVKEIVCRVPTWAKGCPINAECESAERYKK
jgi:DNA polymerase